MTEAPAVNTSPLVFLSRSGMLELLRLANRRVVIPRTVMEEIAVRGPDDVTVKAVETTEWLSVVETPAVPDRVREWNLGKGESAVLTWALMNPGTEIIIDDLAARRCATTLGIPVRGTIGLVLKAKRAGVISAARPAIEQLRRSGLYLSKRVVDEVLALVDE